MIRRLQKIAVSMTTNLFEVSDKYFDIWTWNMTFFIQKRPFCVFFQMLHKIGGFFIIYQPCIQPHSIEKLAQSLECRGVGLSIDTKH